MGKCLYKLQEFTKTVQYSSRILYTAIYSLKATSAVVSKIYIYCLWNSAYAVIVIAVLRTAVHLDAFRFFGLLSLYSIPDLLFLTAQGELIQMSSSFRFTALSWCMSILLCVVVKQNKPKSTGKHFETHHLLTDFGTGQNLWLQAARPFQFVPPPTLF